jgi:diguanylate cyclase (GGDEF)-like protein
VATTHADLARTLEDAAEIEASRKRMQTALGGRERVVTLALAAGFLGAASACAAFVPSSTRFSALVAAIFVLTYAIVTQVEFEVGPGSAVPTQLVLVPMLFAVPAGAVPLLVASGLVLGGLFERARSRRHGDRILVLLCSAWHSVGPALVIGLLAPGPPTWDEVPVYLLAFASQLAFDAASVFARHVAGRGMILSALVAPLAWVALVDATLAPAALVVAYAAAVQPLAVLCVLPVVVLLHLLGGERRRRIDDGIVLGQAVQDARRVARSDPLTGVGNRLAWQEEVDRAEKRLGEQGLGASVILVDLNRLKETNDTYGHDAGDRLIQSLAVALHSTLPPSTELARIGGDEFAILLPGTDELGCSEVAGRIRATVCELEVGGIPASASLGKASCPPCDTLAEALRVADERLYADKAARPRRDP